MLRRSTRGQCEKQQEIQKVDRDMHLKEIEEVLSQPDAVMANINKAK